MVGATSYNKKKMLKEEIPKHLYDQFCSLSEMEQRLLVDLILLYGSNKDLFLFRINESISKNGGGYLSNRLKISFFESFREYFVSR